MYSGIANNLRREQFLNNLARALLVIAAACTLAVASLVLFDIVITLLVIVTLLIALFYSVRAGLVSFALVFVVTAGATLYTPPLLETLSTLSAASLWIGTGINLALGLLALAFAERLRSRFSQTLAESAERELHYRSLLEASPDAIIRYDRDGYYREAFQPSSFRGVRSADDVEDRRVGEVLPADVAQKILGKIEQAFVTGELQTLEHPLTIAGELHYREVRLIAMNDHEVMAIIRDITEQTRQAQQLRKIEERNRALLDVIPDGIIHYNRAGYSKKIFQPSNFTSPWPVADLEGSRISEILPAEVAQQMLDKIEAAFVTKTLQTLEHSLIVKGELSYQEVRLIAMNDHEGIAMTRNITSRKKTEYALADANRHKSEFLATMSHELRTPLTAILGFSEMLSEQYYGPLNDKQTEYTRDIHDAGQHLLALINDILDLSKIEAGKLELHPETIDLQNVAESALRIVAERAQQQGLHLTHQFSGLVTPVQADARKLRQMLCNYLSNAVKFTPQGGSVTLNIEGTDDEVRFEVTDTGVGIPQADQAKLFKSFSQVDSSLTRQHTGTGLGLALVKQLAELHGGTVWVRSEVDVGSTFGFSVARGLSEGGEAVQDASD